MTALNCAATWDIHPSYDTRARVLARLLAARAALDVVRQAEGIAPGGVVAGIDTFAFDGVVERVKARKGRTDGDIRSAVVGAITPRPPEV